MSTMQFFLCLNIALIIGLITMEIVVHIGSGHASDNPDTEAEIKNKKHRSGLRTGFLVITIISCCVTALIAKNYYDYGAFYDEAWRMPGVEKHFGVKSDDTRTLQKLYDADPENFDFNAYKVVMVRLGCEDCENVMDTLKAFDQQDGEYYVIFSRSDIGQKFVDEYDLNFIPSVCYNGAVIELRSGDANPDIDDTVDSLTDLLKKAKENGELDNPGTAAGFEDYSAPDDSATSQNPDAN